MEKRKVGYVYYDDVLNWEICVPYIYVRLDNKFAGRRSP